MASQQPAPENDAAWTVIERPDFADDYRYRRADGAVQVQHRPERPDADWQHHTVLPAPVVEAMGATQATRPTPTPATAPAGVEYSRTDIYGKPLPDGEVYSDTGHVVGVLDPDVAATGTVTSIGRFAPRYLRHFAELVSFAFEAPGAGPRTSVRLEAWGDPVRQLVARHEAFALAPAVAGRKRDDSDTSDGSVDRGKGVETDGGPIRGVEAVGPAPEARPPARASDRDACRRCESDLEPHEELTDGLCPTCWDRQHQPGDGHTAATVTGRPVAVGLGLLGLLAGPFVVVALASADAAHTVQVAAISAGVVITAGAALVLGLATPSTEVPADD